MEPVWLRDDLKAEVTLALLEKPESLIKQLHDQDKLRFFAVRIIMNLICSNTSPFYKKFRGYFFEIDQPGFDKLTAQIHNRKESEPDLTDRFEKETREDLATAELALSGDTDVLTWYERELVKLYQKHGNYRGIGDDTGIPWESCYKTIQAAFKKLRYYAESTQVKTQPCIYQIQTNRYE